MARATTKSPQSRTPQSKSGGAAARKGLTTKTAAARSTAAKKGPIKKTAAAAPSKATARTSSTRRSPAGSAPDAVMAQIALRLEVERLLYAYADCLDHGDINLWPDFFTDDCIYKLISRENYDLGLPLGTMFAEGRGGLIDRAVSVTRTTVYHERTLTHLITNTRILSEAGGVVETTSNYAVLETLPNQYTKILNSGEYRDRLVRVKGELKIREKLCIFDSALVPASIIHPI